MSLWTPDGERPVAPTSDDPPDLTEAEGAQLEEMQAQMQAVREQVLAAPASVVIANHAMGVYELAAIHLTADEPKLSEAVLAIDTLSLLVDGLAGRLGEAEATLQEGLGQLRSLYLEVRSRSAGDTGPPPA